MVRRDITPPEGSRHCDALLGQTAGSAWATWVPDEKRNILREYAAYVRPVLGAEDPFPRDADPKEIARALGLTVALARDLPRKAPPVRLLTTHQRVRFVGATNDPLPDALAVAFDLRKRRRRARLEVFFLADHAVRRLSSDDRQPDVLVAASQRTRKQLAAELPLYAKSWALFEFDDPYCFCSLVGLDRT